MPRTRKRRNNVRTKATRPGRQLKKTQSNFTWQDSYKATILSVMQDAGIDQKSGCHKIPWAGTILPSLQALDSRFAIATAKQIYGLYHRHCTEKLSTLNEKDKQSAIDAFYRNPSRYLKNGKDSHAVSIQWADLDRDLFNDGKGKYTHNAYINGITKGARKQMRLVRIQLDKPKEDQDAKMTYQYDEDKLADDGLGDSFKADSIGSSSPEPAHDPRMRSADDPYLSEQAFPTLFAILRNKPVFTNQPYQQSSEPQQP